MAYLFSHQNIMNNIDALKKRLAKYRKNRRLKKKLGLKPNRTYKRVFDDKKKLQEMLTLCDAGWSDKALAIRFNCDHSSVIYQRRKHGVVKRKSTFKITHLRELNKKKSNHKYADLLEEELNQGHNYKEYLEKENKRTTKKGA